MQFEGAHIQERGADGSLLEWWVVIVQPSVLRSESRSEEIRAAFERQFRRPGLLMAQDELGTTSYSGPADLVEYMTSLPLTAITWQRFALIEADQRDSVRSLT